MDGAIFRYDCGMSHTQPNPQNAAQRPYGNQPQPNQPYPNQPMPGQGPGFPPPNGVSLGRPNGTAGPGGYGPGPGIPPPGGMYPPPQKKSPVVWIVVAIIVVIVLVGAIISTVLIVKSRHRSTNSSQPSVSTVHPNHQNQGNNQSGNQSGQQNRQNAPGGQASLDTKDGRIQAVKSGTPVNVDEYRLPDYYGASYQGFITPDKNILCTWYGQANSLSCEMGKYPEPREGDSLDAEQSGDLAIIGGTMVMEENQIYYGGPRGGVNQVENCIDPDTGKARDWGMEPSEDPCNQVVNAPVLEVGKSITYGNYTCLSQSDGLLCVNTQSGQGIKLGKTEYQIYR